MTCDEPNMSIFVGYAAKDVAGTTSGQISDMQTSIDTDEMYASWIGEAHCHRRKRRFCHVTG